MKRTMRWMWEYEVEELNEKGKPVKTTRVSETKIEGGKKIRVAHYR